MSRLPIDACRDAGAAALAAIEAAGDRSLAAPVASALPLDRVKACLPRGAVMVDEPGEAIAAATALQLVQTGKSSEMSHSDAFALQNSGLNAFLFAEVGTEANGSPLTILSVLARLGQDPWTEAARWAKLPRAAIIDCLAHSIGQMPLCPQALQEARATAARLVVLLPSQGPSARSGDAAADRKSRIPEWAPLAVFCAALAFGILFELIPPATAPGHAVPPLTQPVSEQPRPGMN